jgi:hypothetical protein
MQALAHLNATMSNTYAAIEEDAHKSTCLIHGLEGEGDAELGGKHCKTALAEPARRPQLQK